MTASLKIHRPATSDPRKPLKNQKALVTGANSDIGEACAIALGAAGAVVVVDSISDPTEAGRVVHTIKESSSEVIAVEADRAF